MRYLLFLSLLCSALAQDTFYCPDGWHKYDGRAGCNCFWLAEYEMVTRDDASVLCSFHEAYVAELDGPALNYWLKGEHRRRRKLQYKQRRQQSLRHRRHPLRG